MNLKMDLGKFTVLTFFLCVSVVFSQTKETDRLLQQSFETVYSNPDESLKVSQHVLKNTSVNSQKAKAFLLSSVAHYTKGEYDQALSDAFEAKNLSSEKKDSETFVKSISMIADVLYFLQLDSEAEKYLSELSLKNHPDKDYLKLFNFRKKPTKYLVKDLLEIQKQNNDKELFTAINFELGKMYLRNLKLDSAKYFATQPVFIDKNNRNGWWEAQSLKLSGEIYFQQKRNDSAIVKFEKALSIAEKINNIFLQKEIHQQLSANYLALDIKSKYHEHNQKTLALSNQTDRLENSTANTAHQLISQEQEDEMLTIQNNYNKLFWILLGLVFSGILVKIILLIRNRNKLKTYKALLNYLNREAVKEEIVQEVAINDTPRTTTLLKESEDQILVGLQKFEASKRFISNDMSLGMLASQLNTNTKYLSEVINRHKQKNFNSYINELRINYITEKIKNEPNYRNYKVSYLAEECGFSSHSTFTTVFKSVVGVSPITFVDFIKNELIKEKEEVF